MWQRHRAKTGGNVRTKGAYRHIRENDTHQGKKDNVRDKGTETWRRWHLHEHVNLLSGRQCADGHDSFI
jgi:hypothetical protein